jgi:hypothetical protein
MENVTLIVVALLVLFGLWVGLYMPSLVEKGIASGRLDPSLRDRKRYFRIVGYIAMLFALGLVILRWLR